jgi:hypothetical protein
MLKLVLAVVVLAHGVGHLLFLGPSLRVVDWAAQTSHSWLLTGTLGDGPTRAIASAIWAVTIGLFVVGVAGYLAGTDWWRPAIVAGALVSAVGILLFWDGLPSSSAIFALACDVLLLLTLLVANWSAAETGRA